MGNKEQVELNYKAFQEKLPTLSPSLQGKFALMRDGQIIEFFDTARDAYIAGQRIFQQDQLFSIQEVTNKPVDLGFFSYALRER